MRFLNLLLFVLVFTACSKKEGKVIKPEQILSQQVMTEILTDMHLTDAHLNLAATPQDSAKLILTHEYKKVFGEYNIDQKKFNESYAWYENHSDKLDAIYDEVIKKLEALKDEKKEID